MKGAGVPRLSKAGRFPFIVGTVLILLSGVGCASKKPNPPSQPDVGIAGLAPSESVAPEPIFPHAEGWKEPSAHGSWVHQYGRAVCEKCHDTVNATASNGTTAPACKSCHAIYPHETDWKDPTRHGAHVLKNGKTTCATQCHGADLKGGLSTISCTTCHDIYPHPGGWAQPEQHGKSAQKDKREVCKSCHGDDLRGGTAGVSCYQCHSTFPHAATWGNGDQHGAFVVSQKIVNCGTQCHGTDFKGGLSGVACDSCHKIFPHPATWRKDHGQKVKELGKEACQGCHGADLKTLIKNKNCYSCHADYPHPKASVWTPFKGGHGEKVQKFYSGSAATCLRCHKTEDCASCHPAYPHPKTGGSPEWKTFEGHGYYTLLHSKAECQTCHGNDFQGGARHNPSCSECHPPYPHLDGWRRAAGESQGHGAFVQANGSASCAKSRCHGTNLIPEPRISQGINCNACHQTYPHPADWRSGAVHGPLAKQDISKCKTCHGADLDRAPPGVATCKDCHDTFLKHDIAKTGATGWDQFAGHGQYFLDRYAPDQPTQCQLCHGNDYAGGLSNRTCMRCHISFPHVDSHWSERDGHGAFVMANGTASCATSHCHGTNLIPEPNISKGMRCASCHTNFPHPAGWRAGTLHGPAAQVNIASCKTCHGANLDQAPPGSQTCKDCHESFLHHDEAQIDSGRWRDATGHVAYVLDPSHAGVLPQCGLCHELHTPTGPGNTACKSCHVTSPHPPGWANAAGHGAAFVAGRNTAASTNASCWNCHGAPAPFDATQTKADLLTQSTCYQCHWAYPHTSSANGWPMNWEPVIANTCGPRAVTNFGHVLYILDSPLVTNAAGIHSADIDAVAHTCGGGTAGSCHSNGNRSYRTDNAHPLCGGYCHSTNRDWAPELPDCIPPTHQVPGAPTITSTTPARDAVNVAANVAVTIRFSEAMQRTVMTGPGIFSLIKISDGSRVDGRPSCSADGCQTFTLTPLAVLPLNTLFEGRLTTAATDYGGTPIAAEYRWRFTTVPPDVTPPTVVSTNPANGAIATPYGHVTISVHFSEVVQPNTVTRAGTFTVTRHGTTTAVNGEVTCNTYSNCQDFTFTNQYWMTPFAACTSYDAKITTAVRDLAGNAMAADYRWTFTTLCPNEP